MFVKIEKSNKSTDNKGTSSAIISYLSKENEGKTPNEFEGFFNHDNDNINEVNATELIDNQNKNLGKTEAKFYTFTVNPSQKEMEHLSKIVGNDTAKSTADLSVSQKKDFDILIKSYTKNVMELYAYNFKKNIKGSDLVYIAKQEEKRKYSNLSKEVQSNKNIEEQIKNKVVEKLKIEQNIDDKKNYKSINNLEEQKRLVNKEIKDLQAKYITIDEKPYEYKKGNKIKDGDLKAGFQTHIHIVVHHNTKDYIKISPNATSRGHKQKSGKGDKVKIGFNHKEFKENSGNMFNEQFNYKPKKYDKYSSIKGKVKGKVKQELTKNVVDETTMKAIKGVKDIAEIISTLASVTNPTALLQKVLTKIFNEFKPRI